MPENVHRQHTGPNELIIQTPPEFSKIHNPGKDDNIDFKYWPGWV